MATLTKAKKHTPTKTMRAAAQRGLAMIKDGTVQESDVPENSLRAGRKIAAGQQISDDHVRSMASYHSAHGARMSRETMDGHVEHAGTSFVHQGCPVGGDAEHCDDLMWGGPAGASWSASRVAAMDATDLAECEAPELEMLLSQNKGFSMEIYARGDILREGFSMEKDSEGLIWAPILRSATLAMRPGPKGKERSPLIFVAGHAADSSKEIGLQDLVDAFDDRAVEHVTIPETHSNGTLENTGTIVRMKIADSTMRPGEKVILAGHKFTEPDVEGKVVRGSVLSRSCGILHNYENTETGKAYPHVIEHVALTNRPWVPGMEPYGQDYFSEGREIVPMLLSEEIVVPAPEKSDPAVIFSTSIPEEQLERELKLADVKWGDEPSLNDIQRQLYKVLRKMGESPDQDEPSIYFSVMDITPTKALVNMGYGDIGGDDDAWVIPYSIDAEGVLHLSDFSQWDVVEKKWVADDDAAQDKAEVQQILQEATKMSNPAGYLEANILLSEDDLNLSTLTSKTRKGLDDSEFVFPKERRYPIHDLAHARNALARVSQHGTPEEKAKVRAAVKKRYPNIVVDESDDSRPTSSDSHRSRVRTDASEDPRRASILRLSQEPNVNQRTGGVMAITSDLLDRLDLDDNARELLQREIEASEQDRKELADLRRKARRDGVKERVSKLSEIPAFKGKQGVLRFIEQTLLSDDGDVAIRLDLADGSQPQHQTVTQIFDKMIELLADSEDPSATQLAETGKMLSSPIPGRPDLEPEPLEDEQGKPLTGQELFERWEKDVGGKLDLALAPVGGKEK
jgi:hypothetical protein